MTQEQKDLLKKVLCEMLPYGVKLYHADDYGYNIGKLESINISNDECVIWNYNGTDTDIFDIEICKPVLRSMSSMTDEEIEEYVKIRQEEYDNICESLKNGGSDDFTFFQTKRLDFLISHHFDYRGLIKMGLALEAPKGMYNF